MPTNPVVALSRVAKSYRAGMLGCAATVEVLRELTLCVDAGEFVTIEGARGAGKTTLLLCAAGMLRPDAGHVTWPAMGRAERPPSGIGYAAERTPMYGFLTVRESIAYAVTVRELHDPGPACDIAALMTTMSLEASADLRVGLLDAGERARLLVAFALVTNPRLLLVDDLAGASDVVGRATFVRCLARIAAAGAAVVWTARQLGMVTDAVAAYQLVSGQLRPAGSAVTAPSPRTSLELDVPAIARAAAALAPRVHAIERRGARLRVSLDRSSAEEVLALCRDLAIPVRASRVVREP